jgi:hypothetical protein
MKTLLELQPLIIEWATDKNIHLPECAPKQRLKLIEECGELASAILKSDVKLQKDAIGDVFVVLVILNEQSKEELFFETKQEINTYNISRNINQLLFYCDKLYKLFISFAYLKIICNQLNLNLEECANIAWNEIKDRKGKTVNGTFIKN